MSEAFDQALNDLENLQDPMPDALGVKLLRLLTTNDGGDIDVRLHEKLEETVYRLAAIGEVAPSALMRSIACFEQKKWLALLSRSDNGSHYRRFYRWFP